MCLYSQYNTHPLILCSSQWARGNGGEEGDKAKANTKGESKIAPKVQTHRISKHLVGGKSLAKLNKHCDSDSSVARSKSPVRCGPVVIVVLRSPPGDTDVLVALGPFSLLPAKSCDPIGRCWACSHHYQLDYSTFCSPADMLLKTNISQLLEELLLYASHALLYTVWHFTAFQSRGLYLFLLVLRCISHSLRIHRTLLMWVTNLHFWT